MANGRCASLQFEHDVGSKDMKQPAMLGLLYSQLPHDKTQIHNPWNSPLQLHAECRHVMHMLQVA